MDINVVQSQLVELNVVSKEKLLSVVNYTSVVLVVVEFVLRVVQSIKRISSNYIRY